TVLPIKSRYPSRFIDVKDCRSGVAGHSAAAHVAAGGEYSKIPIVHDGHGQVRAIDIQNIRIVLGVDPLTRVASRKSKVTILAQFPQNIPATGPIGIVDFDDPAVVAD